MLKNYPFWKGQWVWQLSSHRPSALRVPASAPGHTPQLSCSAQLRPHLSLGFLDAAGGHPGESYLQVQAVLDSPGVPEGRGLACIGLGSASGWPRCRLYSWPGRASPILSHRDWPHHAEHPTLLAWGCPSSPSVHLHPPVAPLAPSNCLTIKPSSWKNLPCFLYTNDSIVHTYLYGRTAYARTHPKSNLFHGCSSLPRRQKSSPA